MSAAAPSKPTSAELEQQIAALEQAHISAHTRAVNAARHGDLEAETAAIEDERTIRARLLARREALTQARLEEAAAAQHARNAAIEHVVGTILPALEDDVDVRVKTARRERTSAAVRALDLACRRVSALRSRLLELTGNQQRFHPSAAPHPSRLLGEDPELTGLWQRVRSRAPIDTTDIYAGLPPA